MLWLILLEHFYGRFIVYLVYDVASGTRHYALAPYWDHAVAYSPTSLCLTREQGVGDPTGDDFVIAILMRWLPPTAGLISSPTPHWEEALAREILFQPRKEVIKVVPRNAEVNAPIREDEQANGLSSKVGEQLLGYPLSHGT